MKDYRNPPQWSLRLLRWFCKPWYVEVIEGDLFEIYSRQFKENPSRARRAFTWNIVRFFRWRYLKDLEDFRPQSSIGMFKTYLKVSFRSMKRNKLQSLLNIFGLAVGIAGCMLILMHVTDQLRYDKHISDLDRIYRVVKDNGAPYTPARLVSQMQLDYPEIESGTRVNGLFEAVIEMNEGYMRQEGCVIADSTFFDVFDTRFLKGDAKNALNQPNSVVLTESVARNFFPDQEPMGQIIRSEGTDYTITAVVEDQPKTATIPYQLIVAIPRTFWATEGWWTGNNFFSYLKLKEHVDPESLEAKFPDFVARYIAPEILQYRTQYSTFEDFLADGNSHSFHLVPMKDIHLNHSRLTLGKPGSYQNMVVFSLIAFFILIIASVNYINMTTARSSLRAKEIGMRKVLGSVNRMIAWQFMVESFMVAAIAIFAGALIAIGILPFFNHISDSQYVISDLINGENLVWFLLILLFIGLLSGSYPALYLSSFKPVAALRGESVKGGRQKIRSALVIVQFTIAIFLVSATFIVFKQVSLMSNRSLGLEADQIFIIRNADKVLDKYPAFRNEAMASNYIDNIGISNAYPSSFLADWNYQTIGDHPITIGPYNIFVTSDILDIWGLELIQGRFFDKDLISDTAMTVVNEQLVKELGWENPLGQILSRGKSENVRVIGVVRDFVTGSAKRDKYPLLFRYVVPDRADNGFGANYLMVKITGNYRESITHLEDVWKKFVTKYPFDGMFMDDSFDRLYASERRFGMLFTGFSALAIVIASIGLFALVSFTLERKRKEIALRKVMGARVLGVVLLVLKGFGKLILISAFIAIPAVFYLGNNWLENYVYRISIDAFLLIVPVMLVFFLSVLTVAYQAYKSASSNPVHALKEE